MARKRVVQNKQKQEVFMQCLVKLCTFLPKGAEGPEGLS